MVGTEDTGSCAMQDLYVGQAESFTASVDGTGRFEADGVHALWAAEVITALRTSAERRSVVRVERTAVGSCALPADPVRYRRW